jgi:hypothetical protein
MFRAMRPRFPDAPVGAGHYESVYVKAADPTGRRAVWIRHTVHKRPGEPAVGSVWLTLFDAETAEPFAVKESRPAGELAAGGGDVVRTGAGAVRPDRTTGDVAGAGRTASWDLAIRAEGPSFPYLPHRALYRAPLPRTKAVSAVPSAAFDGELTVEGRTIAVDGWHGMVGHNWGREHAERWIWLHGAGLDVILGRVRVGPVLTPWIANGMLELDGVRHRIGGLRRPAMVDEAPDRCTFAIDGGRDLGALRGEVVAPRGQVVAWTYADPGGGEHHALNCSIADLRLTAGGRTAEAAGSATYELGVRERDHGIPLQPFGDP